MAILIFDFDGTIHDSMRIYAPAVRFCHRQMVYAGIMKDREVTDEEIRSYLGLTASQMWKQFAPDLPETQRQEGSRIIYGEMARLAKAGAARLYQGVPEVLDKLKKEGHKLVFLSNCSVEYMDLHRDVFRLDRFFDEMYCAAQFGWISKPEIVGKLLSGWICQSGHVYQETVISIGDRKYDMEIAGAKTKGDVTINTIFCAYGFGNPEEGESAGFIVNSVWDIPDAVETFAAAMNNNLNSYRL